MNIIKITRRNKMNVCYSTSNGITEDDCIEKMTPRQFVQAVRNLKNDVGFATVYKRAFYKGVEVDYSEVAYLADGLFDEIELY